MIRSHRYLEKAFALPTILIASVVMIIVMLAAIQSVVSIRIALDNQYYDKLAQEAGESGTIMATNCIKQNDSTGWAAPLKPGTDCNGAGTASYVLNSTNVRTSFSVPTPTIGADGVVTLNVQSTVELLRTSNSLPWKTYTQSTAASILTNTFEISSGNDTTCATINGRLYCWGDNQYGQIGNNTTTSQGTPFQVNNGDLTGKFIYKGTSGLRHTCAIAGTTPAPTIGDSKVYCWGSNGLAQFGRGTTSPDSLIPLESALSLKTQLPSLKYTDISAGHRTCVVGVDATTPTPNSRVWCWGENYTDQAGDASPTDPTPGPDPKLTPTQNAVITSNSTSAFGALRYATNNASPTPTSAILTNMSQVNLVNSTLGCGLSTANILYCWGSNSSGGFGIGTTVNSTLNSRWIARPAGSASPYTTTNYRFTKFATNYGRVCAIGKTNGSTTVDGKIYCWGSNGEDPNVDYRTSSAISDVQFGDIRNMITTGSYTSATFSDVAMGDWTICGIRSDAGFVGQVWCWGYNDAGQLGTGTASGVVPQNGVTPTAANKPIAPSAMVRATGGLVGKTIQKITSGNDHFCAMTTTGSSYCWGDNTFGQLGNGSIGGYNATPTRTKVPITVTLF